MRPCFIGCDIGTQGTKTAIYAADGALLADSFEASVLLHPEPGAVTQDPEEMLGSVCRTIRAVLEKSGITPDQIAAEMGWRLRRTTPGWIPAARLMSAP